MLTIRIQIIKIDIKTVITIIQKIIIDNNYFKNKYSYKYLSQIKNSHNYFVQLKIHFNTVSRLFLSILKGISFQKLIFVFTYQKFHPHNFVTNRYGQIYIMCYEKKIWTRKIFFHCVLSMYQVIGLIIRWAHVMSYWPSF